jgi:hypothetical protein
MVSIRKTGFQGVHFYAVSRSPGTYPSVMVLPWPWSLPGGGLVIAGDWPFPLPGRCPDVEADGGGILPGHYSGHPLAFPPDFQRTKKPCPVKG